MQELEATWSRAVRVWWLIIWRGVIGAAILGGVIGFIIGFVGALLGLPSSAIGLTASLSGGVIGIVWMIIVVRMALRKQYSEFRLALVPHG